jgi:hypothetical protein
MVIKSLKLTAASALVCSYNSHEISLSPESSNLSIEILLFSSFKLSVD